MTKALLLALALGAVGTFGTGRTSGTTPLGTPGTVRTIRSAGDVQIHLPRFKVETQYALNDTLAAMGMTDAFDFDKADFGGMVTSQPEGRLAITAVVHKAYCDVNEEGTEAAAATGVAVGLRGAPAKPKVFKADHPFLFAIRHNFTNTILFLGRVTNPKG